MTFFTLIGTFWLLLWVFIPDATPGKLSLSDFFRSTLLLFSSMAFVFTCFILILRFKGLDIFNRLFPQAGMLMWVARRAYRFSQPKTNIHLHVDPSLDGGTMWIKSNRENYEIPLDSEQVKTVDLGYLTNEPILKWQNRSGQKISQKLSIEKHLKSLGRNIQVDVLINKNSMSYVVK